MQTETLNLVGLTSEWSAHTLSNALKSIAGVQDVRVSYIAKKAVVQFDENQTAIQELAAAVKQAGFAVDTEQSEAKGGGSCCGGCCH